MIPACTNQDTKKCPSRSFPGPLPPSSLRAWWQKGWTPTGPVRTTSAPEPLANPARARPCCRDSSSSRTPKILIPWRCICSRRHGPGLVRQPSWLGEIVVGWLAGFVESECFIGCKPESGRDDLPSDQNMVSGCLASTRSNRMEFVNMEVIFLCETSVMFSSTLRTNGSICSSISLQDAVPHCKITPPVRFSECRHDLAQCIWNSGRRGEYRESHGLGSRSLNR